MRTQMIETTTHQRNGHMPSGFGSSEIIGRFINREMPPVIGTVPEDEKKATVYTAFFSRPAWITTGVFEAVNYLPNQEHADLTVRMRNFFARPTWITTGTVTHLDNWDYIADVAFRTAEDMTDSGPRYTAFFSRPTWITTGSYELSANRHNSAISWVKGNLNAKRPDYPDKESLRFATAVLALKMALAAFGGNQRIYPRR